MSLMVSTSYLVLSCLQTRPDGAPKAELCRGEQFSPVRGLCKSHGACSVVQLVAVAACY